MQTVPLRHDGPLSWPAKSSPRASGVNSTATIHDTSSETAITTNSVKVNSPALLLLRPIGMKPATVTSVPVSIGKAVDV